MYKLRFGAEYHRIECARDWPKIVQQIERWGYSSVCLPDHFYTHLAAVPALAAAAISTSRLRLTSHVLSNSFRHPLLLAKEAATIDFLSDGRLELGIGTGWHVKEHLETGIALPEPAERLARLNEAVQVIRSAFEGRAFSFTGKYITVRDYVGIPRPARDGGPPILIGGGSRGVLSLAARTADIVGLNFTLRQGVLTEHSISSGGLRETRQKLEWIEREAAREARTPEISVRVNNTIITDDRDKALKNLSKTTGAPIENLRDSPHVLCGTLAQIKDDIAFRRNELGISYFVITGDAYRGLRPIVEALSEI